MLYCKSILKYFYFIIKNLVFYYFKLCVCLHMSVCRCQRWSYRCLSTWTLEPKLRSSPRAACALNHRDFSVAPYFLILCLCMMYMHMNVFAMFVWGICVGSKGNLAICCLLPPLHVSRTELWWLGFWGKILYPLTISLAPKYF